ncbi:hypothetical protein CH373_12145 [Leptospira perolatii]|uniref:Cyclase n=1 Tax=Leptospira perolatii TaxID=2023191 RepID=A0A2M9ZL78_9LEPT|nr:cyclase family protein [Leptospira perolatii]PJZ70309.1 hypothetical protein CH360_06825 [Leptospira perolatii]PJZ72807.1 hypothetical protein CH373_12145 [Leptospira perolatii]
MELLSYSLSSFTPAYGEGIPPSISLDRSIARGDSSNSLFLKLSNHSGTHIDAPFHFDEFGKKLTDYNPDFWTCSNGLLIKFNKLPQPGQWIDKQTVLEYLQGLPEDLAFSAEEIEILLLSTGWSSRRGSVEYSKNSPGISEDVADFLRERFPMVRFLGFDLISISSFSDRPRGRIAHKAFLMNEKPILPIEDMDLSRFDSSTLFDRVLISPWFIEGADGAPVTVWADRRI